MNLKLGWLKLKLSFKSGCTNSFERNVKIDDHGGRASNGIFKIVEGRSK